ncbi:hypothetical protein HK096_001212 [Nowakowskiella sp. JEL0078]|nr:hypothetical protein HK096_001212 [Nowakowskiella sp. JEL0078]
MTEESSSNTSVDTTHALNKRRKSQKSKKNDKSDSEIKEILNNEELDSSMEAESENSGLKREANEKPVPYLGLTLLVRSGKVYAKELGSNEYVTTVDDGEEDDEPIQNDTSVSGTDPTGAVEAWIKEYGYAQGWTPEYREMYAASAAAAGYGDLARQWSAWGGHAGYTYPLQHHPHFAAQFGHHAAANYYGQQYGAEGWQQYQQATAHQIQSSMGSSRARKRQSKNPEDGDVDEDDDGDDDQGRKSRKTRPNFSKDVIALLTNWILTHYDNPYPQKDVKQRMQEQTGLSELQLDNWYIINYLCNKVFLNKFRFSNARRRLLVKDESTKRYSIANRAPKKRGPKSRKEGDSDFDEAS